MSEPWIAILKRHADAKGRQVVARELDISVATISLVINGKYPASTEAIEKKVMSIYGHDGKVQCPVLGDVEPTRCIDNWERAQKIKGAGNPATIRLYIACRKCDLRSS